MTHAIVAPDFAVASVAGSRPVAVRSGPGVNRVARLDALTSLRFLAAAMIVVNHSGGFFGIVPGWGIPFPFEHGVSFFFVLSGFILTHVYPTLSWRAAPRFWWARIARIWPAHLVGFLLALALVPASETRSHDSVWIAGVNLLLLHGWMPIDDYYFSFNAPSWSVSTELGFYLLFPLLIVGLRRTWIWKLALSIGLLIGMIVLGNMIPAIPFLAGQNVNAHGLAYINPLARLFEFVLGMGVCLLWQRIRMSDRLTGAWCTIGEVVAVCLTASLMYWSAVGSQTWVDWFGEAGRTWVVHGGSSALGFAAIILIVAVNRGLGARLLSLPAMVILGEISYSVYLIHQTLLKAYGYAPWVTALPAEVSYPAFWFVLLVLAYCTWRFVEWPARRLLVGAIGGSATQPAAASEAVASGVATPTDATRRPRQPSVPPLHLGTAAAVLLAVSVFALGALWLEQQTPTATMLREFYRKPGPEAPVGSLDIAPPERWPSDQRQTYRVRAINQGERTWFMVRPAQVFLHIMFVGPGTAETVDSRVEARVSLDRETPPGGEIEFDVSVAAPRKEGTYRLRHQLELDKDLGVSGGALHETVVTVTERRSNDRQR